MKRKVVSHKSLPARIPLISTAVLYLLLDKFHAPEWLWASIGTLWVLFLIGSVIAVFTQEPVELYPSKPKPKEEN